MNNIIGLMALGIMFAGSVLADSAQIEQLPTQQNTYTHSTPASEELGPYGVLRNRPDGRMATDANVNTSKATAKPSAAARVIVEGKGAKPPHPQ